MSAHVIATVLLVAGVTSAALPVPDEKPECTGVEQYAYGCPDGGGYLIGGEQDQGGDPGPGDSDGSGGGPGGGAPRSPYEDLEECLVRWGFATCYGPIEIGEPVVADPGVPAVTITDVARFVPVATTLVGEPFNVGVAGYATNFISDASVSVVQGELFGRSVSVEFTPVRFDFDYGDGEFASTTTGGTPWESIAAPQFTPTDTSHAYRDRGTYTATVTVTYAARVDLGTGWIALNGTVTGPPAAQSIRIYEARSALVSKTCDRNPDGIGC